MHPHAALPPLRLAHDATLSLERIRIVGVLNITPDSFSDGGLYLTTSAALDRAKAMVDQGAACLDIGGESTRPGADRVHPDEQCRRVLPVIEAIRGAGIDLPISIDTTSGTVAARAIDAGASAINDVSAGLEDPALFEVAAARRAALILMHRLAPPDADAYSHQYTTPPDYRDAAGEDAEPARAAGIDPVVPAVRRFLARRAQAAIAAGVRPEAIVLDPGLGFGKTVAQNFALMAALGQPGRFGLADIRPAPTNPANIHTPPASGLPLLGAASRKSFLGHAAGVAEPSQRVHASVAAAVAMALAGVRLIRAHDVAPHREALAIVQAMLDAGSGPATPDSSLEQRS